jgi:ribosome-binding factor A
VTPDLQQARVYYTALGDEKARRDSARALGRAAPFLRRQIGARLRLRRVPELAFLYDESIAGQDRIEQLLQDLHASDAERAPDDHDPGGDGDHDHDDDRT